MGRRGVPGESLRLDVETRGGEENPRARGSSPRQAGTRSVGTSSHRPDKARGQTVGYPHRKEHHMLARLRKSMDEKDQGFTLIELLVVIIIIGILAAIAIPVFLNQRKKGWDAQAKSDLKNMATAEETYLTDNGLYTAATSSALTPLTNAGFKTSADVTGHTAAIFTSTNGGASAGY